MCRTTIRRLTPSIVLLKNLYNIDLSCCKDLQLLPALPLNIKDIRVDGCTSDDFHPSLSLLNCFKLIENQGYGSNIFLIVLRRYFQVSLSLTLSLSLISFSSKILICMFQRPDLTGIGVIIPGSEIPKWFRHQSMGASMDFHEGPLDFMGIAVCAIFVRRQHQPLHQSPSKILGFCVSWCYSVIGCTGECEGRVIPEEFVEIDSYNLWLKYFPFKKGNFEE